MIANLGGGNQKLQCMSVDLRSYAEYLPRLVKYLHRPDTRRRAGFFCTIWKNKTKVTPAIRSLCFSRRAHNKTNMILSLAHQSRNREFFF